MGISPLTDLSRQRHDKEEMLCVGFADSDSDLSLSRNYSSTENVSFVPETPIPSRSHRSKTITTSPHTTTLAPANQDANEDSSKGSYEDPKHYVKRLLNQHYHLGRISSRQFSRILERASRKVEQGQVKSNCVDKGRIKKLVNDFVEAYTLTNPELYSWQH